jgi:hypothetical protein
MGHEREVVAEPEIQEQNYEKPSLHYSVLVNHNFGAGSAGFNPSSVVSNLGLKDWG